MEIVNATYDCPTTLFTTKKFYKKKLKDNMFRKVKHLLVNTHLETRKELNFSIIKIKDI
jgi:hypothetical protein